MSFESPLKTHLLFKYFNLYFLSAQAILREDVDLNQIFFTKVSTVALVSKVPTTLCVSDLASSHAGSKFRLFKRIYFTI